MDISNITSLPTDSLYKFMAISGLLITVIATVAPFYFRKNLVFQLYEVRMRLDLLSLRHQSVKKQAQDVQVALDAKRHSLQQLLQEKHSELFEGNPSLEEKQFDATTHDEEIDQLNSKSQDIAGRVGEQRISRIELECDMKKIEFLAQQLRLLTVTQVLGFTLGISLSISGFYFWYTKIQVYIDKSFEIQSTTSAPATAP